jgi:hypothetical protein
VVLQALQVQLAAKPYRMKNVYSSSEFRYTMQGDYVAPDKYHVFMDLDLGAGMRAGSETIIIGGVGHSKTSGGWDQNPSDTSTVIRNHHQDQAVMAGLADAKDAAVTLVGTEDLDGKPANVYQSTYDSGTNGIMNGEMKVWVNVVDGLPYKVEINGEMMQNGKRFKVQRLSAYQDYNADMNVSFP